MMDEIGKEFALAELGDARLTRRAVQIAERWNGAPSMSFPKLAASDAELEGLYGLFENDSVTHKPLLSAHCNETVGRIDAEGQGVVLVVHDTTSFAFGGEREGMGWLGHDQQGFFAHFALALSADGTRRPFGVVGLSTLMRERPPKRTGEKKKKISTRERAGDPDRESLRWGELVDETSRLLRGHAVPIHIVDREAESYEWLAERIENEQRFVARARVLDRSVTSAQDNFIEKEKLRVVVEMSVPVAEREVHLHRRRKSVFPSSNKKHPPRDARKARLEFSAETVRLTRPDYLDKKIRETLDVNIVHVRELDPPADVEPVEWFLLTTEPISTAEEVLRIVDYYRARWTIEEFNKAIKTGCAYESRQLETTRALLVALALCIPIAWQMLLLRTQSRTAPDAPATTVVTDERLEVLRTIARKPLPANPTARQVYYAIAALGGHLERNGPPGWKTLRDGLDKLFFAEHVLAAQRRRDEVSHDEDEADHRLTL